MTYLCVRRCDWSCGWDRVTRGLEMREIVELKFSCAEVNQSNLIWQPGSSVRRRKWFLIRKLSPLINSVSFRYLLAVLASLWFPAFCLGESYGRVTRLKVCWLGRGCTCVNEPRKYSCLINGLMPTCNTRNNFLEDWLNYYVANSIYSTFHFVEMKQFYLNIHWGL